MIDVKLLRETPKEVRDSLKSRGYDLNIAYFEELDEIRKVLQIEVEQLQSQRKIYQLNLVRPKLAVKMLMISS